MGGRSAVGAVELAAGGACAGACALEVGLCVAILRLTAELYVISAAAQLPAVQVMLGMSRCTTAGQAVSETGYLFPWGGSALETHRA